MIWTPPQRGLALPHRQRGFINMVQSGRFGPGFVVDAAEFDGTNDLLARGAALTGIANGQKGTISFWVKFNGGDGTEQYIFSDASAKFQVYRDATNTLIISVASSSGISVNFYTTSTITASSGWVHVWATWDMSVTNNYYLKLNGSDNANASTWYAITINYAAASDWYVGCASDGSSSKLNGALAELWFDPTSYMSAAGDVDKFRSGGKPKNLGTDGSTPTGAQPIVYLHLDDGESAANFATNRGSGGNFSVTGALATASTSPSD